MTGSAADGERTPSKHTMILLPLHVSLPKQQHTYERASPSPSPKQERRRTELVLLHFVRCQALTPTPLNKEPSKCGQPALIAHSSVAMALAGCLNQPQSNPLSASGVTAACDCAIGPAPVPNLNWWCLQRSMCHRRPSLDGSVPPPASHARVGCLLRRSIIFPRDA